MWWRRRRRGALPERTIKPLLTNFNERKLTNGIRRRVNGLEQ